MYQIDTQTLFRARSRGTRLPRVGRTVVLLGLVSFFTDVSSEMVVTVLPVYLVYTLGLSPLAFGVLDGLHQGAASLVRIGSGFVADRFRRHKETAVVGYGLSAATRIGFLAAGSSVGALGGLVLADRIGKGIRTAPRDALISLSAPRASLGAAFGIHRALDTAGAMLGPLLAFALLALSPLAFDSIFVVSFCFAVIGVAILVLFVRNGERAEVEEARPSVSLREALGVLRARRFAMLVAAGAAVALTTISDGFVYLALQRRLDFDLTLVPLLYVGTAAMYMLLSVPLGRLADRVGRARVFVAGYALLLVVYATLLLPPLGLTLPMSVVFFGAYYAATEGVLMAHASTLLPPHLRATGLAVLVTATTLARLLASIAFGATWVWVGLDAAIVAFTFALLASGSFAALTIARRREPAHA